MKMKIKMKMLGAVILLMAMLVGSANAQRSTIDVKGFIVGESVYDGEDVVYIDFDVTSVVKLYKDSTYYLYNKSGDFYSAITYKEGFTTDEKTVYFLLSKRAYKTFLLEGVGSLDLGNGSVYYFDDKFSNTISEFLAAKSTALRTGENIEEEQ